MLNMTLFSSSFIFFFFFLCLLSSYGLCSYAERYNDGRAEPEAAAVEGVNRLHLLRSKRQSRHLSVNQDLVSLADMLHDEANRRKVQNAKHYLASLGKRSSSRHHYFTDDNNDDDDYEYNDNDIIPAVVEFHRGQRPY